MRQLGVASGNVRAFLMSGVAVLSISFPQKDALSKAGALGFDYENTCYLSKKFDCSADNHSDAVYALSQLAAIAPIVQKECRADAWELQAIVVLENIRISSGLVINEIVKEKTIPLIKEQLKNKKACPHYLQKFKDAGYYLKLHRTSARTSTESPQAISSTEEEQQDSECKWSKSSRSNQTVICPNDDTSSTSDMSRDRYLPPAKTISPSEGLFHTMDYSQFVVFKTNTQYVFRPGTWQVDSLLNSDRSCNFRESFFVITGQQEYSCAKKGNCVIRSGDADVLVLPDNRAIWRLKFGHNARWDFIYRVINDDQVLVSEISLDVIAHEYHQIRIGIPLRAAQESSRAIEKNQQSMVGGTFVRCSMADSPP